MTLILAPAKLIEITLLNDNVVAASPQGGNALHRKKRALRWRNNCPNSKRVGLYFREWYDLDDENTPEDPVDYDIVWPFGRIPQQGGVELDQPHGIVRITAGATFQAPVSGSGLQMFKYTIHILGGRGNPDAIDTTFESLDPIIVIDR